MTVIDANVVIHGRGNFGFENVVFTPEVIEEIESREGRNVLRNLDYNILEASETWIQKVEEKSQELNSPTSEADESLLALAAQQDDVLVTDDKALQNLALHMNVGVEGFHDPVLEQKFRWKRKCKNCGNEFSNSQCPRCGSRQYRLKQVHCS